jgi:Protein of unknown function (DUF3990)
MARMTVTSPAFASPVPWINHEIVLYHGTIQYWSTAISSAINVTAGRTSVDFGQGFYTTTVLTQARSWAWEMSRKSKIKGPAANPIVFQFTVSREELAKLDSIWYVRGTTDAEDYWSLVTHCRSRGADHGRSILVSPNRAGWYDLVIGPVAASWRQRLCLLDCDQISFHSPTAASVLDASAKVVI